MPGYVTLTDVLTYERKDIFTTGCPVLVNPVNLVGVMGKGLALEFKRRFPAMFTAYREACRTHALKIGQLQVYRCSAEERLAVPGVEIIINFPTKTDWRLPTLPLYVEAGLDDLARMLAELRPASVALPALGCGLGGLSLAEVRPLFDRALAGLPCPILVCLQ